MAFDLVCVLISLLGSKQSPIPNLVADRDPTQLNASKQTPAKPAEASTGSSCKKSHCSNLKLWQNVNVVVQH